MPTAGHLLAILSTCLYFSGLVYFKVSTAHMPALGGLRPRQLARELAGDRTWTAGAALVGTGACVQAAALARLSICQAQPMFLAGLVALVLLAVVALGERLTPREWGCVLLLAAATILFVRACAGTATKVSVHTEPPSPALVVTVALASLAVPVTAFLAGELSRTGVHARPLTGVALATNVGLLTGTAELMLTGAAALGPDPRALATAPYLYLFVLTAPLALGQLQIALQRSRLVIVGLVATATAKTYLFVMAMALYGKPWLGDHGQAALALALSVLAVTAVPHHERPAGPAARHDGPFVQRRST
ncbi:hypothetical protein SAMN04489712_103157 [Thermomonospora echinospora]|uniref:Uncharacterized protein n=1 Tax=Thermomonospora echinospora TaxID=1992 RepID=A0A1H5X9T8_9ACTN|nr:hypothetical protein [Thermomonospora echinospora]SEG08509.1 hypothetical protein SAMN04489712_103157 [Thermomonospora echinospora]